MSDRLSLAAVVVGAALLWAAPSLAVEQEFSEEGATACLECHESEKIMAIFETPHAKEDDPNAPLSREECESCHGPSATHMQFPLHVGNIRFGTKKKTPHAEQASSCLECHAEGSREHWKASPHGFEDMTCADCHNIHKAKDPILVKDAQNSKCTEACHEEIIAKAPPSSPHPFDNKEITCMSCHNPHGPLDMGPCLECHPNGAEDLAKEPPKAREYHERAIAKDIGCIECHQGTAHNIKGLEALESPMEPPGLEPSAAQ
jgi:predicted CXXCH cytochrome family protein